MESGLVRAAPLYIGEDHGAPIRLSPEPFAPATGRRGGGWGAFARSFLRFNRESFEALDLDVEVKTETRPREASAGFAVFLRPGGRTGAVPLHSGQTNKVVGGLVIKPRFGWAGVGRVLAETGWPALPTFHELPAVPGSGREIPPWVLAGPVLKRLGAMLEESRRGYTEREDVLTQPRGRILWQPYMQHSLARGRWHRLPCRFPELEADPMLRRYIRWALDKVLADLVRVGPTDPMATSLAQIARRLLALVKDVAPARPRPHDLEQSGRLGAAGGMSLTIIQGLEALAWVEEERGLGGGRELKGMAWSLALSELWEAYVEQVMRGEAAARGGQVQTARQGETTVPLLWSDPMHRSLGHLIPDLVIRRGRTVQIVDAKYKAHLAELDYGGWRRFTDKAREAHRADLHQVLAYAALFDADEITATLVYPLRFATWRDLERRGRDRAQAEVIHGGRRIKLELRGLPFGDAHTRPGITHPTAVIPK